MKTMKKFLSMAALAVVGAVMTGCSSDDSLTGNAQEPAVKNNVVTLTTTVNLGDGTRALTDGGVKTFAAGDKIAVIYKNSNNETKKAESEPLASGGSSSATFTVTLENPKASGAVRYIYPAAMAAETVETSTEVTADATINYAALASQDGTLATLAGKYDLAVFDGSLTSEATLPASSTLENKLAILAYTIKNADASSDLTNTITRLTVSDGPNTYGISRTAAEAPVYIAIRPTSGAKVSIMAAAGLTTYTKCLTGKTYAANNIYKAGLKMTEVPGAIPGMFSISSGGKAVFSKGNLYYDANATTKWYFATNQWDCISTATGYPMDHFTWGNIDSPAYNGTTYYAGNANLSGSTDWGSNMGTGWRTLTGGSGGEWEYLFNTRTVNNGTGSGKSYTLGKKVNNVLGLVLYPDDYTGDEYSGSDWSTFESAGCVFLPAAGYRNGTSVAYVEYGYGYYWSSTANGEGYPYYAGFSSDNVYPASNNYRDNGILVRLVRPVQP